MRVLDWANELARKWWPLTASLMAGVVIGAVVLIMWTVLDERSYFEAEQARDRHQDAQVQELLEQNEQLLARQREVDAGREHRLQEAVADVEDLLVDHFALHDQNVAEKLNELLVRIAALLDRPAGVPIDPVAAHDVDGDDTRPPRTPREAAQPRPSPSSTTTTTSPGQSGLCERVPTAFPCRRPS